MKVVIAPDSFKESLPAAEVAAALAAGVRAAWQKAEIDLCPMADGGEGTVSAMVAATGGQTFEVGVSGPLGEPIQACFGLLGGSSDGRTAVLEMAAASGLALVPPERRNPLETSTFGTGELILAALDAGARRIIVGVGGSATCDGGCGCGQALGVSFKDCRGNAIERGMGGGALGRIDRIDLAGRDRRLGQVRIRVACDVENPLIGPDGAAAVYAPQKSATNEMVAQLEAALEHLAEVIHRQLDVDVRNLPGAGAAGGLGAGLVAFAGAGLARGVEVVAEAVGLASRLTGADLCITGEGRLDAQSAFGKTTVGVAKIAARAGAATICIPAQVAPGAPREPFAAVCPLVIGGITVDEAMRRTKQLLELRAAGAVQNFLTKR